MQTYPPETTQLQIELSIDIEEDKIERFIDALDQFCESWAFENSYSFDWK